jgi:hypothetical protein
MPNVNTDLHRQLESLHQELSRTSTVDTESRALLITLVGDITRLLGQSGLSPSEHHTLTERLDELAVQFEAEHPALGSAIRQVVDTLGKAGI